MADLDLFESLLNCNTVEELHTTAAAITKQMGFEHFIYGVQVNTSLTRPYQFVLSGYPKQWRDYYVEMKYQEIDPTVQHVVTHTTPLIWRNHIFKGSADSRKMRAESKDVGLNHGVSFSVHGGRGESVILSLATSRKVQSAEKDILANLGRAQLLACYIHEGVQRVVLSRGPLQLRKAPLSPRQKECLLWAAEGKTSAEISDIINISERTVISHLENAAKKMKVTSRQHAVSRAVSMGLISP